jgi:hypothetical protein
MRELFSRRCGRGGGGRRKSSEWRVLKNERHKQVSLRCRPPKKTPPRSAVSHFTCMLMILIMPRKQTSAAVPKEIVNIHKSRGGRWGRRFFRGGREKRDREEKRWGSKKSAYSFLFSLYSYSSSTSSSTSTSLLNGKKIPLSLSLSLYTRNTVRFLSAPKRKTKDKKREKKTLNS